MSEATVATWFKKQGDHVAVDEMLCELETDKVTVEVPSPVAGTISEIVAPEGTTVSVEALLAQIKRRRSRASTHSRQPQNCSCRHSQRDGANPWRKRQRSHRGHLAQAARRARLPKMRCSAN